MVTRTATIKNSAGIHLRPSGLIMQAIESYDGTVRLGNDSRMSDIDSIMGIIALGLCQGDTVTIEVEGEGEHRMADELVTLFETRFDFPPR